MPPEPVLAERYGVSRGTIRRVLTRLEDQGWVSRRKGHGTFVAANPPTASLLHDDDERWIGVLIELDIAHPDTSYFWLRLTQGLRQFFQQHNAASRLYAGHSPPFNSGKVHGTSCQEFHSDLAAGRLRGLITVGVNRDAEFDAALAAQGIPALTSNEETGGMCSHERIIGDAVDALVADGRQRLALMAHGHDGQAPPEMLRVFQAKLREHHMAEVAAWQAGITPGADANDGASAFRRLWAAKREKPDGLVITDEMICRQVEPAIIQDGIHVPQELAIATHFNRGDPRPLLLPATRVEVDPAAIARRVGRKLLDQLQSQA